MAQLLIHGDSLDLTRSAIQSSLGLRVQAAEEYGDYVFLAVASGGAVTALIGERIPLRRLMPGGETHGIHLQGEEHTPEACQVSSAFTACLLPLENPWRSRAAAWQARVKASASGEHLLGAYPVRTDRQFGFDPEHKEAFRKDATRYLKRLRSHLNTGGEVDFNAGGPGVMGEAHLTAQTPRGVLRVRVGASGNALRGFEASECGTCLWWCVGQGNSRGAPWQESASNLAATIRQTIASTGAP